MRLASYEMEVATESSILFFPLFSLSEPAFIYSKTSVSSHDVASICGTEHTEGHHLSGCCHSEVNKELQV